MAKSKATITVDRAKVDDVRRLVGARSTSEAIDMALDGLLHAERIRADVAAYTHAPRSAEEEMLAAAPGAVSLDDDVDWEALYDDSPR